MRCVFLASSFVLASAAVAAACPDPAQSGSTHHLSGKELYAEKTYNLTAGGDVDIRQCRNVRPQSDSGAGYVMTRPDYTFNLSGMASYKLVISTESDCDSILLVNTATMSWYYDDDDGGNLDARVELTRPEDGWLDVWVGTHDGEYCDAVLSLETFNR